MTLSFERARTLVNRIQHRDNWYLTLEMGRGGPRLWINAKVKNSRYEAQGPPEKEEVGLSVPRYAPPEALVDEQTFLRWVLFEVLWVALHEEMEWFRDIRTMKPILDPHESETTATRLLPPRPGEEWWR